MKKLLLVLSASLFLCSNLSYAEVIDAKERQYELTYPNGNKDTFIVEYKAHLESSQRQTGHSAGFPNFVDTRQCHWNIETYVTRKACLLANSGDKFCEGKLDKLFPVSSGGSGSSFSFSSLQGDNCGKMAGKINAQVTSAKATLTNGFNKLLEDDPGVLRNELIETLNADSVVEK